VLVVARSRDPVYHLAAQEADQLAGTAAFLAVAWPAVNFFQRYMRRGLAIALVYVGVLIPTAWRGAHPPSTRSPMRANAPSTSRTSRTTSTTTRRSAT
jgi:hypothetical protein